MRGGGVLESAELVLNAPSLLLVAPRPWPPAGSSAAVLRAARQAQEGAGAGAGAGGGKERQVADGSELGSRPGPGQVEWGN